QEEEFEHFNELEALRRQIAENNALLKKMQDMKAQALEERDKAEGELATFSAEIAEYQRFVGRQLGSFGHILDHAREQKSARDRVSDTRRQRERHRVEAALEQLSADAAAQDTEQQRLAADVEAQELKLQHYETRFQEVSAATGLSEPDAIVNKFFFKGEIKT